MTGRRFGGVVDEVVVGAITIGEGRGDDDEILVRGEQAGAQPAPIRPEHGVARADAQGGEARWVGDAREERQSLRHRVALGLAPVGPPARARHDRPLDSSWTAGHRVHEHGAVQHDPGRQRPRRRHG